MRHRCLFTAAGMFVTAFVVTPQEAFAQTAECQGREILLLEFQGASLQSGTDLTPGAVYRFSNVATGVDAIVSIDSIINGSLTTVDNDIGLVENFQPELSAAGGDEGPRSADFTITLVTAGGSTPVNADFASSGVDVDGDSGTLREYAEFSAPITEFALETPTLLALNASTPSVPGDFRFEASTPATAPGIDETATQNIVSVFYTATSSFRYRIGTLGDGGTTRLMSLDFTCPNINFPVVNPQVDQDFGDAPLNNYGNPVHDFVSGIQLGATNTIETAPFDSATASGDSGDDATTLPTLTQGQGSVIDIAVSGSGGVLQAWIDFDDDGDFDAASDQIASDIVDGGIGDTDGTSNGIIRLTPQTPVSANAGVTFARLRWSTQSGLSPTSTATDGEVEDYQITINAAPPSLSSICPAGQSVASQTGNAISVVLDQSVDNQNRALGALAAAGTSPPDSNSAELNSNGDLLTLDLGVGIPENSLVTISLGRENGGQGNDSQVEVLFSDDNINFVPSGIYGVAPADFISSAQNVLEHNDFTVPVAGAQFVQFDTLNNDDIFVDGVEYTQVCITSTPTTLDAVKTVSVYDPTNAGLFAIPGNEVIYEITASNTGNGPVDVDSIFLVDLLPPEVEFFTGDFDDGGPGSGPVEFTQSTGAGLTFDVGSDLAYATGSVPPANFLACGYNPVAVYDPAINFVCFNPKGVMNDGTPDPTFTVRFRTRIK